MKLDYITEDHIEKFVRFPELLSKSEKEKIRKAITESPELQELANWFRNFYDDLDKVRDAKKRHVISLTPFEHSSAQNSKPSPLILAAKSNKRNKDPLETIATFVSEEEQTVVRVLYKHNSEEYQIHLLRNEEPKEDELFILSIDEIADFVIDSSRHISFASNTDLDSIDWDNTSLSLRSPVENFKLTPKRHGNKNSDKSLLKNGFHIEQNVSDKITEIKIRKSTSTEGVNRLVTKNEGDSYEIFLFGLDNTVQISLEEGQQNVSCWLFE